METSIVSPKPISIDSGCEAVLIDYSGCELYSIWNSGSEEVAAHILAAYILAADIVTANILNQNILDANILA